MRPDPGAQSGRFVAVAGNIAAGKSSLTRTLAEALSARPLIENVTNNPFFDRFYDDPGRWAFDSQVAFAADSLLRQLEAIRCGQAVQDRTAHESYEVFARVQFQAGHLSKDELRVLGKLHDCVRALPEQPDLLIYLHASTSSLVGRIADRDRAAERRVDLPYLELLQSAYDQFIGNWKLCPVVPIDTDKHDMRDPGEVNAIVVKATHAAGS